MLPNEPHWRDLTLGEILGEGKAGAVYRATLRSSNGEQQVAVKRYKAWVLEQPDQRERIDRELRASIQVSHPNLVKNLALVLDDAGRPALISELYLGRTLESYLTDCR